MAHIEQTIEIQAGRQHVWNVVSRLRAVSEWNPNIESATCEQLPGGPGVGATRTCYMSRGGHIDEVVSEWDEGRRIQFAIGNHGGIRSADMGLVLADTADGTSVTAIADYHIAYGPLGPVIDRLAVKRQMARMLTDALTGLKEHVQNQKTEETQ